MSKMSTDITSLLFEDETYIIGIIFSGGDTKIAFPQRFEICNKDALYSRLAKYFDGKKFDHITAYKVSWKTYLKIEEIDRYELKKMYLSYKHKRMLDYAKKEKELESVS